MPRCTTASFYSILSVTIRTPFFPPVARQPGISRVVFQWSDELCGSPLSSIGTPPAADHGVLGISDRLGILDVG